MFARPGDSRDRRQLAQQPLDALRGGARTVPPDDPLRDEAEQPLREAGAGGEAEPAPEDSFTFSRRAVTNSLLDKLKTRIPKPDNRVSAADLQKRLSRLPH